jgi:3-oxoacyl-(acyl-carrier-protein) synthase
MRQALSQANLRPEEIEYINAHGNGLVQFDISETGAIKTAFGEYARRVMISSIKPIVGQSFSATGLFQLITCLLAIQESAVPPTANYRKLDPRCDLYYVPDSPARVGVERAMMNAHGFGGSHTVLIAGRYRD